MSHILVVEDDHDTLRKIAYRLQYAGYEVTQAASGEAALDLLEMDSFNVVVTDILMGQVGGIEILHTARRLTAPPAVILLTGHGALDTCIDALRAGAYDYLLKPCSPEHLLACVAGAVQRHQAEQQLRDAAAILTGQARDAASAAATLPGSEPPVQRPSQMLRVGRLVVGQSRHEVWFCDDRVRTTPIEYTLLRYLAEHTGELCPCSEIVLQTHGLRLDDTEAYALVKSHVQNLRKKLHRSYLVKGEGRSYMLLNPDP